MGAIEIAGVEKSFGSTAVLRGIDLEVAAGSVTALLGPNGAGKTTLVRILSTLVTPDAGTARVAGFDVVRQGREVRRAISLTGQYAAVDELLTGAENLDLMGRLHRLGRRERAARRDALLAQFDLAGAAGRRVGTYSGGMRRRLDLAAGLVGRPEVIFLDEPTTGLDPRSRQGLWDVVRELAATGVTVLLTTQYLEEADQLADRIAVLDEGAVVAEGTAEELKQRVTGRRIDVRLADGAGFAAAAALLGDAVVHRDEPLHLLGVPTGGTAGELRQLLDLLAGQGIEALTVDQHSASLDEVFLTLTGHAARPEPVLEASDV